MRQTTGNGLSQYAIIIGIIVAVLIPVLTILGTTLVSIFGDYSQIFGSNSKQTEKQLTPEVSYDFTSTNKPFNNTINTNTGINIKKSCTANICKIDFGEFTLNGIPQNFNEMVETLGVAGGTDLVSKLLRQIANAYAAKGMVEESKEIMKMAKISKSIANVQKNFDDKAKYCADSLYCLYWELATNNDQLDIDSESIGFQPDTIYGQDYSKLWPTPDWDYVNSQIDISYNLIDSGSLGIAMNDLKSNPEMFKAKLKSYNLGYAYLDSYNKIMKNEGVSDVTKAVINELSKNMDTMGSRFTVDIDYLMALCLDDSNPTKGKKRFSFNGEAKDATFSKKPFEDFMNYNAGEIKDFNGSIMCAAGKAKKNLQYCK